MAYTIGIDVGGTKVAAGVLDEWGKRIDEIKYPSDPTDSEARRPTPICRRSCRGM